MMINKLIKRALPVVTLCLTVALANCDALSMLSNTLVLDSLCVSDSVMFTPANRAKVSISCQYAVGGNPLLVDSVNAWIAACLNPDESSPKSDFQTTKPDIQVVKPDIQAIVSQCLGDLLASDSCDMAGVMDVDDDVPELFNCERDYTIKVVYEDDDFVTFEQTFYSYLGGAHGCTLYDYATFSKSGRDTGKRLGWDLVKDISPLELQCAIERGLADYLELRQTDNLRDYLFIQEGEDIPLPCTAPFLTEKGVMLMYQEYEIGPYAMGTPSFVIKPTEQ